MKTLLCDCNRSMALDAPALARALAAAPHASADGVDTVHTLLCRGESDAFRRAAQAAAAAGDTLVVACTQERRRFAELAAAGAAGGATGSAQPIRFVNIRETAGWSRDGAAATPKIAALLAAAQLPPPEPVPTHALRSAGRCVVIGGAEAAERAAAMLGDGIDATLLLTATGGALAQPRDRAATHGRVLRLGGWLGAFDVEWEATNPIDPDRCTRCNRCVEACPEGAIGLDYQVDADACTGHRDCVVACGAAAAIDFDRAPQRRRATFDLVLDLRDGSAFALHAPPQGYFHTGEDAQRLVDAVLALRGLVGTFTKPRHVHWDASICAHSRNAIVGCDACVEVCSARAITSFAASRRRGVADGRVGAVSRAVAQGHDRTGVDPGAGVRVEPALCIGCGACSTVCPSGAMAYATPGAVDQGRRIATLLATYARAGGRDAALLVHGHDAGSRLVDELGRGARIGAGYAGVPPRVLPLPVPSVASVGLDLWLAAIAHGASQVWVLATADVAPEYVDALTAQMAVAQAIVGGLGYRGEHFRLLQARDARDLATLDDALRAAPALGVAWPADFAVAATKRPTLELALDHLRAAAPGAAPAAAGDAIALPPAAPFGTIVVDRDRCTLCLACVGACPAAAISDDPDRPRLRFVESRCVQCGLCARTCPEDAITLEPRLWLADAGRARREWRMLNEAEPHRCVRCGRAFGTRRAVEAVAARLAGHPAYAGAAAERLRMCVDCRVVDVYTAGDELRVQDL